MAPSRRKRSSGVSTPSRPNHQSKSQQVSHRRGDTLVLSLPSYDYQSPSDMANYQADPTSMHNMPEPLFDDAHLSYVSVEFAKMRPFDFKLPEYEFYQDTQETWFDDEMDDFLLEDLADFEIAEDIATTIYFVFPGKPRVVDISPPASIRGADSSSNSRPSSKYHSRSSSYSDASQSDDRASLDSGESEDSHDMSPSTPASLYSNMSKNYFSQMPIPPRSQQRPQMKRDCSDAPMQSRSICT